MGHKARSRPGVESQRESILAVAAGALSKDGTVFSSAESLARASGVSRATFYRCFPTSQAVIDELHRRFQEQVEARIKSHLAVADTGPMKWIDNIVSQVIDDAVAMGPLLAAFFREEMREGSPAQARRSQRIESQVLLIEDWWNRNHDTQADRDIVHSMVLLLQIWGLELCRRRHDPAELHGIKNAVTYLIRTGIEQFRG